MGLVRVHISCFNAILILYQSELGLDSNIMLRPQLETLINLIYIFESKDDIIEVEHKALQYYRWSVYKTKSNMEESFDSIPKEIRDSFYPPNYKIEIVNLYNDLIGDESNKKYKRHSFLSYPERIKLLSKNNLEWLFKVVFAESSASIHVVNFYEGVVQDEKTGHLNIHFFEETGKNSNGPLVISSLLLRILFIEICSFFNFDELNKTFRDHLKNN